MLSDSPFTNYLVPGLFLLFVNGLGNFFGGFLSIRKYRYAGYGGMLLGAIMMGWILVQVAILGWVNWLQQTYLFLGGLELILGFLLNKELSGEAK